MADLAYVIGAAFPAAILLALGYFATRWWAISYVKSGILNVCAAAAAVFLHALGNAHGGPLNFINTGPAIIAQVIVFSVDFIRIYGIRKNPASV